VLRARAVCEREGGVRSCSALAAGSANHRAGDLPKVVAKALVSTEARPSAAAYSVESAVNGLRRMRSVPAAIAGRSVSSRAPPNPA